MKSQALTKPVLQLRPPSHKYHTIPTSPDTTRASLL